jgi:protein-disulfide isomerase
MLLNFLCLALLVRVYTPSTMSHFSIPALLLFSVSLATTTVAQKTDTPNTKQPVATVDGQPIFAEDLAPSVEGQIQPLRNQEYEIKRKALDSLIEQKMLEAAAKKKGVTVEKLIDQEVVSKIADPSDAEVEGYYYGLSRMTRPFDEVKSQLKDSLKQAKVRHAREEYIKNLHADSNVVVLLSAPRVEVAHDPARLRGNPKAAVMIVEFSDYQCPYCHQAEPTVKEVLAKYGDKVSLSYRDFPLSAIHPQAMIAAEASRCALEQGKFWEYHDQLFTASKLEKDDLIGYARNLKLDEKQFESCLTSEKYKADIEKDTADGHKAGVSGTPGFFVNGIEISGAKPKDDFAKVIDDELARKASAANSRPTASIRITRVEPKPSNQ